MKNKNLYIKKENIVYFFLFIYFVVISSFRLTYGIDSQLGKISLGLLILMFLVIFKKIRINSIIIWLFAFWGWYFLSILWSSNVTDTSFYFVPAIKVFILSLILSTIINSKDDIQKVLKLLLLSLVVSMVVLFIKTPISTWGTSRIGYAIGLNPNALGIRYCLGAIMCFYFFDTEKRNPQLKFGRHKIMLVILLMIMLMFILGVLFSGSKKALFCLAFGLVFFAVVSTKGLKKYFKIILLFITLIIAWNFIKTNEVFYKIIGSRVEDFINYTFYGQTSDVDVSSVERAFFRKEAFELFAENWLIGSGGNGFVTHMRNIGHGHIAYCHNNYLELLCTLGIIGFSIFYSYIGKIIFFLYRKIKNNKIYIFFLALILCTLISDYGGISYFEQFNITIITIIGSYVWLDRKEEKI